jgi:hypothetical protein
MAPMTTAVESDMMPKTAIAVDNIISDAKRVKNWRRDTPCGKSRLIT